MPDAFSRVSSKFRTVIPKNVRQRLALRIGDVLRFDLTEDGTVTIDRLCPDEDDPFETFAEWASDEDTKLYVDL